MKINIKNISAVSMFTALLVICSWVTLPFDVPFTLQIFAVFAACLIIGGKLATISVIAYILLGAVGLPVFSYMGTGLGALTGATGGFIFGFILICAVFYIVTRISKNNAKVKLIGCILGLTLCYCLGTVWYVLYYTYPEVGGLISALFTCVIPFIIPDLIKLFLAFFIYKYIRITYPLLNFR